MRVLKRLAFVIWLFSGCAVAFDASAADPIVGTWQGTVSEPGSAVSTGYTVVLEIDAGAQAGAVEYTTYPCGGRLNLIRAGGGQYLYGESLTFGRDKCLDNLRVRATITAHNRLYFEELLPDGSAGVYGDLHKTAGPTGATCETCGDALIRAVNICLSSSAMPETCVTQAVNYYYNCAKDAPDACERTKGRRLYDCLQSCENLECVRICLSGVQ